MWISEGVKPSPVVFVGWEIVDGVLEVVGGTSGWKKDWMEGIRGAIGF